MNRKSKHARLLELGKDVLIVLLACSAVWLTTRVQRTGSLGDLLADTPQEGQGQTQAPGQMEMVRPVRMAAVGRSGETTIRYGAQYDQQSTDALFQQVANLLVEALSDGGEMSPVSQWEWRTALTSPPSLYFDLMEGVPLSVLTGYPVDNLDIQWFQAAAQTASYLMALLWWRYLWPRSFMARRQGERPLGGGTGAAWKRIVCVVVIGLSMQVVVGYVTDAVLSLLPEAAADYSELVEETGMGDTSYLAVLTTVLGAPFCEELLVRGIIFEFSLRAFNPQCRPLWKRRRRASAQDGAMVPWAAPSTWGIAAAIVLQAAIFGFMHMNWVQGCYAGAAGLIFGWVLVTTGKLRYTILLHFAFNAGSYLMTLLWFVNTPFDVAITVAIAGVILVEAMRSLRHACGMDAASAPLP